MAAEEDRMVPTGGMMEAFGGDDVSRTPTAG